MEAACLQGTQVFFALAHKRAHRRSEPTSQAATFANAAETTTLNSTWPIIAESVVLFWTHHGRRQAQQQSINHFATNIYGLGVCPKLT
jgi:hypothetical protein